MDDPDKNKDVHNADKWHSILSNLTLIKSLSGNCYSQI